MANELLLTIDRTSVCAGDDVDSHQIVLAFRLDEHLAEVIQRILNQNYLPQISGGKATWIATSRPERKRLAVIAQQWSMPKFVTDPNVTVKDTFSNESQLLFEYHAQKDPENFLT